MSDTYKKKEIAARYDFARALPDNTLALWMGTLRKLVPIESVSGVLDLGGGTGRFAKSIHRTYKCRVIVIDPSEAMLQQGNNLKAEDISWICGAAEHIPLAAGSIDLVWMSQVFHHLENQALAFKEINRVLSPTGYLVVRNGTRESDAGNEWIKCFPEAKQMDEGRIPFRTDVVKRVCQHGFYSVVVCTVYQQFASSYVEYYQKISQRGLSSLISISDEAFTAGLERLREWVTCQPQNQPVNEPVDLFVFQKRH